MSSLRKDVVRMGLLRKQPRPEDSAIRGRQGWESATALADSIVSAAKMPQNVTIPKV